MHKPPEAPVASSSDSSTGATLSSTSIDIISGVVGGVVFIILAAMLYVYCTPWLMGASKKKKPGSGRGNYNFQNVRNVFAARDVKNKHAIQQQLWKQKLQKR
jgi:hypothetical protein